MWLWTRSAPATPAAIVRSIENACERGGVRLRPGERVPGPVRDDRRAAGDGRPLVAPAVHRHVGRARELAGEVLDVDAGAAVDVGRVLAREERDGSVMPRR